MDMYRLEDGDLSSIDLPAYLASPGLVVIEWPEFIMNNLPTEYLKLKIKRLDNSWDSTEREIEIEAQGQRNQEWWQEVSQNLK